MSTYGKKLETKLNSIVENPNTRIHYSGFRDVDRDLHYRFSVLSNMIFPPMPIAIINSKEKFNAFTFARHTSFNKLIHCLPNKQKTTILSNYSLNRRFKKFPAFYSFAYHMEYGKRSLYWSGAQIKHFINDETFFNGVSMHIMINPKKRRSMQVIPEIKQLCDKNHQYAPGFQSEYNAMKHRLQNDINILNKIRNDDNKTLIHSYAIQLRYGDEDRNHHLNVATYQRYIYEALMNYNKDLRSKKKVIFCMSNIYWKEIRVLLWSHCYVNIWNIAKRNINGTNIDVYIGTIDIDKNEWMHHHGFVVGVAAVNNLKLSRL